MAPSGEPSVASAVPVDESGAVVPSTCSTAASRLTASGESSRRYHQAPAAPAATSTMKVASAAIRSLRRVGMVSTLGSAPRRFRAGSCELPVNAHPLRSMRTWAVEASVEKPVIPAVDDDPQVLAAVSRDIRRMYGARFRLVRADNGQSALEALEELALA